jgi:hypothetical protein
MRDTLKSMAGSAVASVNPQCRFERSIFILAHMRCGSTALSNILCSRPDVSGYGEAHVRYTGTDSLGRLVVNQALRRGWRPGARYLFDKILHTRHDAEVPQDFFDSRAIFMARDPQPAIRSIRALFSRSGKAEYQTDIEAATYYIDRIQRLITLWLRFDIDRRVGVTHADLTTDPDATLQRISQRLQLSPPLVNRYVSPAASRRGGGGDPTTSGAHTRIVAAASPTGGQRPLAVPPALMADAEGAYLTLMTLMRD